MKTNRILIFIFIAVLSMAFVGMAFAADNPPQTDDADRWSPTDEVVNNPPPIQVPFVPRDLTAVLYDNGPLVTHPAACGGMDASRLQTDLVMNTLGFGHQFSLGYRMADDFIVSDPQGWQVDQITFFAYQTGAPNSPSPITGVYYQIWNGSPDNPGSIVVYGDLTTNRLISSVSPNLQRDSVSSPCANNRYIFADVADAGVVLPPGTYWIEWMTDGSPSYSGPWAPPITILGQTTTGNALQYTTVWAPALDTGTSTQQGMPFIIEGEVVPPPSISLSKTVGIDPNVCATTDEITVMVGTDIYYCYEVTNTGDVTLSLHDLYDTELGILLDDFLYDLMPGASVFLTQTETINVTTVNTATWTAFNQVFYNYDDTIAYNFEDISDTGTLFSLTDDSVSGALPIGFSFNYFSTLYTDVYASSNGFLTVLPGQSNGCCSGQPIPTAGDPDGVIAGWWEDFNPDLGGSLYYQTLGSAPNRYFIVQYSAIQHYGGGNEQTLQYKLFEGSNFIEVHYAAAPSDVGTHSAGLENQNGTVGTQYYYGTAGLTTPLAVRYTPQGSIGQATATDTAQVNVLFPEIDIAPTSLESTQFTDAVVSKILTISNIGDPMTTLDWMVLESQPGGKLVGGTSTSIQPTLAEGSGSASETVGAAVPKDSQSDPSIIGLNSKPYVPSDVLYDNGPIVTHPGGGAGGADASALQSALGMTIYGFGHQLIAGNRVADDFTITDPGGWNVDTITFYAYQTGSGNNSSITAVNLQIWDGVPGDPGSTVIWGDPTTNVLVNTSWSNVYRVLDTGLTNVDRPVMADTVLVDTHLEPGTYWLDWQSDGSTLYSGPWIPPITVLGQTTTGNGRQYTVSGWADLVDVGTQGLPFVIEGSLSACFGDIPWASVSPITGTLPGGESTPVEVTFDSTGLANGVYTATLCVISNDSDEGLTTVPIFLEVVSGADLEVTKSDSPDPARIGDLITYTLEVTNNGPDASTTSVLEDLLPSNVSFVSASAGCTHVGGIVTCDVGSMAMGASETFSINVIAVAGGSATNTAEVWSDYPDPVPGNNVATEDTLILYNFYLPIVLKP